MQSWILSIALLAAPSGITGGPELLQLPMVASSTVPTISAPPEVVVEPGWGKQFTVETDGKTPVLLYNTDPDRISLDRLWSQDNKVQVYKVNARPGINPTTMEPWVVPGQKFLVGVFANGPPDQGPLLAKELSVIISGTAPVPVPVDPPTPKPPTPPTPQPAGPTIGANGLSVLIVYETADAHKLPYPLATNTKLRDFMESMLVDDPSGWKKANGQTLKAFRFYDKDQDTRSDNKVWQDALIKYKSENGPVPGVFVSNGKTGVIVPLPPTEAELRALIQKFK